MHNRYFIPIMIIIVSAMLIIRVGDVVHEASMNSTLVRQEKVANIISDAVAVQEDIESKKEVSRGSGDKSGIKEITKEKQDKEIKVSDEKPNNCTNTYSENELEILNSLSRRRQDLESWNKELLNKENIIRASEERIQQKLLELKKLQNDLQVMLTTYNSKQDDKIQSLVKIYESMKPKDAARIFEQLDMKILLDVIKRMKEAKSAAIIALMDPIKAKDLTTEFAKQKKYENAL